MMKLFVSTVIVCVLALVAPRSAAAQCPVSTSAATLIDGSGFNWDIFRNGAIGDGMSDSYDFGWVLSVNGTQVPDDATPTLELGGRQVALDSTVAGVNVTRRVYVPTAAPGFARFLDSFTNPTAAPVTITVLMQVNMGSDGGTTIFSTSSGDALFTAADRWVRSDDVDAGGDPSNGLVFFGAGATVMPTAVSTTVFDCSATNGYSATYSLTIPAGETRSLMHLAVQRANQAAVTTAITTLEAAPPFPVRAGISAADFPRIVNWALTPATLCTGGTTTDLTDGDTFVWDVLQTGGINNGSIDEYDVGWAILVNGAPVPVDATPTLELAGRQVAHDSIVGPLSIVRRAYVPAAAPGFARLLDSFTNSGATAVDVTVSVQTNMGSDGGTTIVATSSGDTAYTTADRWVSTDDADASGDPSGGLIFFGAGAPTTPTDVTTTVFDCAATPGYGQTYNFSIPAGETRILMYLAIQRNSRALVSTAITTLETAPTAPVRFGIAATDLPRVINWNLMAATAVCGNGTLEAGEACDDGGTVAGDCCSPTCAFEAAGSVCRASVDTCDAAETCTGASGTCPGNAFVAAGTSCRVSAGVCDVAEACTGGGASCPPDGRAPDGTSCSDAVGCNGSETCSAGACAPGMPINCDDMDPCTTDTCSEPTAFCTNAAITGCGAVDAGPPRVDAGMMMMGTDAGMMMGTDAGTIMGTDSGTTTADAAAGGDSSVVGADAGRRTGRTAEPGCSCRATGPTRAPYALFAILPALALVLARRRRR